MGSVLAGTGAVRGHSPGGRQERPGVEEREIMELEVLVKRLKRALRAHDMADLDYRMRRMREYLATHPIYQGKHQELI